MERVRVKICGITSIGDALAVAAAGADAIGLVFWADSPRCVNLDQAAAICRSLPPFVMRVALFVDPEREYVTTVLERVGPDCLQFHGEEDAEFCESFDQPYIKAVRMRTSRDPLVAESRHPRASALLLDTHRHGSPGGTGQTFDWRLVPAGLGKPVILAGGLDAGNVADAIARVHPFAVDVSGGVESARGIKDPSKIKAFVEAVWGRPGTGQ
jgi:phosphoribosylanthranilate isomerase